MSSFFHNLPPSALQPSQGPVEPIVPPHIALPLSALQVAMLEAAAASTLKRSGWRVTIAGRRASVVTLTKLQERGLVRHVAITDGGRKALDLGKSGPNHNAE